MPVPTRAEGDALILSPSGPLVAGGSAEEFESSIQAIYKSGYRHLIADLPRRHQRGQRRNPGLGAGADVGAAPGRQLQAGGPDARRGRDASRRPARFRLRDSRPPRCGRDEAAGLAGIRPVRSRRPRARRAGVRRRVAPACLVGAGPAAARSSHGGGAPNALNGGSRSSSWRSWCSPRPSA